MKSVASCRRPVTELQKVRSIFHRVSGKRGGAEFHPMLDGCVTMARSDHGEGCEFSGSANFEQEMTAMPNFGCTIGAPYHNRTWWRLRQRGDQVRLRTCESLRQIRPRRALARNGKPNTFERAYAMTNPMEYFAEDSEAFSVAMILPLPRRMKQHDPRCSRAGELWSDPRNEISRILAYRVESRCTRRPTSERGKSHVSTAPSFRESRTWPRRYGRCPLGHLSAAYAAVCAPVCVNSARICLVKTRASSRAHRKWTQRSRDKSVREERIDIGCWTFSDSTDACCELLGGVCEDVPLYRAIFAGVAG